MEYTLRPWQPEDAVSLARYINNIHIWNQVRDALPYPYTEADARSYITMTQEEAAKSAPVNFAVVIDGKAVGGVGFIPGQDVERISAEIGYWLGEPFWGKGIMTDVVRRASLQAFQTLPVTRLHAGVFGKNPASMRVLEKAGYAKEGIARKAVIKNGEIMDFHLYALLKEDIV